MLDKELAQIAAHRDVAQAAHGSSVCNAMLQVPCGAGPQLGLSGRFRKARGQPGLHIPHLSNLIFSYTLGGFIHLLLVAAIIVVLIRIIQGRRPI